MNTKRVGHYTSGYGFFRAYLHDADGGSTQIGSISDRVSFDQLKQFHLDMCDLITERTGQQTNEFCGGYYQELS